MTIHHTYILKYKENLFHGCSHSHGGDHGGHDDDEDKTNKERKNKYKKAEEEEIE